MAQASHRWAGSHLYARSALPADELLALGVTVVEEVFKRDGKPGPISVAGRTASTARCVIKIGKRNVMTFVISVEGSEVDDHRELRSVITGFVTSQQKMFLVIPSGEKKLLGWLQYETFMKSVQGALKAADPSSVATIRIEAG